MKTLGVILLVLAMIFVVGAVSFISLYIGKYNNLVNLHEDVNGGKSKFISAVNTCSGKMKSVWTLADQEGILEKETYVNVAKARSAYNKSMDELEKAGKQESSSVMDVTKLGAAFGQSLLNVRVAFEAYPQLRTTETYQKAMAAVEEGFNEIKTALDDWIVFCRSYNAYRRAFLTNLFASAFYGDKFPEKINYYEGGIKEPEQLKITAEDLNPRVEVGK